MPNTYQRVWGTCPGQRGDHDLQEELQLHMELAAGDARRPADSPDLATRDAAIRAGEMAQAMEALRDQREIGIRMALGAQRAQVLTLELRHGMMLTTIGIGLGLVGAAAGSRFLQGMLFGITPIDPQTFIAGIAERSASWRRSRATCPRAKRRRSIRWSRSATMGNRRALPDVLTPDTVTKRERHIS